MFLIRQSSADAFVLLLASLTLTLALAAAVSARGGGQGQGQVPADVVCNMEIRNRNWYDKPMKFVGFARCGTNGLGTEWSNETQIRLRQDLINNVSVRGFTFQNNRSRANCDCKITMMSGSNVSQPEQLINLPLSIYQKTKKILL